MFFYDLPRFSVDLDFNLLDSSQKPAVFAKLQKLLPRFGKLAEAGEKRFTLFYLRLYREGVYKNKQFWTSMFIEELEVSRSYSL